MEIMKTLGEAAASLASLGKVALLSRRPSPRGKASGELIIMGNGPSLRDTIDRQGDWLRAHPLMAVNFAANTPEYARLRPAYHILADGHFFDHAGSDPNVERLWRNLAGVEWPLTLFVPASRRRDAARLLGAAPQVKLRFFNLTPVEGLPAVSHRLFDLGLGMPRPRNVMIPAIMTAGREGFTRIYLAGADHTWGRALGVDEENRVVSIQPHFYKDDSREHARVATEYAGYHLHDILNSLTVAFRSYHHIRAWASGRGVEIVNATPGSMIDAFPRAAELTRVKSGESRVKREE